MILSIFLFALFVQLMYHVFLFSRLAFYRKATTSNNLTAKISVVVCCKNEIQTIPQLIEQLKLQQYPDYEIIIVDDCSDDGTFEYLNKLQQKNLFVYQVVKSIAGKKELLEFGIRNATSDWILVCDADCLPRSSNWIQSMTQAIQNEQTEIVLGYAPFTEEKAWVNLFSRYENFHTGITYLSMAIAKHAYMGVGRNMMFKKSLYNKYIEQVKSIPTLSGDDDLLINMSSNRENTTVCIDKDSFVYSATKNTFSAFLNQKKRHISTSYYYKKWDIFILSMYPISLFLLWLSYFIIVIYYPLILIGTSILLLGYLTTAMLVKTYCAEKLNFRSKIPVFILDILFLSYQILIHPLYLINKNKQW